MVKDSKDVKAAGGSKKEAKPEVEESVVKYYKDGKPKIVNKCSYELTAVECVDMIVTDLAVIEVSDKGLVLKEVAPGWTAEEIQELTEPRLIIAPDLKEIELM